MKINLTQLSVETDFSGGTEVINCAKTVANYVKNKTSDIGLEDVCRDIFHSDGEAEIPSEYVQGFIDIVLKSDFIAPVKRAIRDTLLTHTTREDKQ